MLELRNELDFRGDGAYERDRERRDFRRLSGHLTHYKDRNNETRLVPGPYTQESRRYWLERVLGVQMRIRTNPATPDELRDIELISTPELQEIRRIWISEKHEIEDLVPKIYEDMLRMAYPGSDIDENLLFDESTFAILKDLCGDDRLLYETTRNLLDVERRYRLMGARHGLFENLEDILRTGFFANENDALEWHKKMRQLSDDEVIEEDPGVSQLELTELDTAGVVR